MYLVFLDCLHTFLKLHLISQNYKHKTQNSQPFLQNFRNLCQNVRLCSKPCFSPTKWHFSSKSYTQASSWIDLNEIQLHTGVMNERHYYDNLYVSVWFSFFSVVMWNLCTVARCSYSNVKRTHKHSEIVFVVIIFTVLQGGGNGKQKETGEKQYTVLGGQQRWILVKIRTWIQIWELFTWCFNIGRSGQKR